MTRPEYHLGDDIHKLIPPGALLGDDLHTHIVERYLRDHPGTKNEHALKNATETVNLFIQVLLAEFGQAERHLLTLGERTYRIFGIKGIEYLQGVSYLSGHPRLTPERLAVMNEALNELL